MNKTLTFAGAFAVALASCNGQSESGPVTLNTATDSASYAIGASIGGNLLRDFKSEGIDSSFDMKLVLSGIRQSLVTEDAILSDEEANEVVAQYFEKLRVQKSEKNKVAGEKFLAENSAKPNVITTESGLQYVVLKEGEGNAPAITDQVKVHYTGKLLNGNVFDSSEERGEPVTFHLRSVIPGWTEMLQLMKPGSEVKAFIPGQLAYGPNGGPQGSGIGPNEVLVFDIRLIDVIKE